MKTQYIKGLAVPAAYGLLSFLVALLIAWIVLAQQNFLYGVWHDHAGIGRAIEHFAPKNKFKPGFADTSRDQRVSLFAEINHAVHNQGEGLAQIAFDTPGHGSQTLLREPEVVHLQDVANLISFLKYGSLIMLLIWGGLTWYLLKKNAVPSLKMQFIGTAVLLTVATLCILLIGPVTVFNTLHIWIFPHENQWFFYYQESLMSTMMWAPYLFGWIAIALVVYAKVFFLFMQWVLYYLSGRRAAL